MSEERRTDAGAPEGRAEIRYRFSETEWQLILHRFAQTQARLSPVMRNNIEKLLRAIAATRTITTAYQADLIISLLLCRENDFSSEEEEEPLSDARKAEKEAAEEQKKSAEQEAREIVERLQLLIMQHQVRTAALETGHALLRSRR